MVSVKEERRLVSMVRTKKALRLVGLWPPEKEDNFYVLRQMLYFAAASYYMYGITAYPFATLNDPKFPTIETIEAFFVLVSLVTLFYNTVCTFYIREDSIRLFDSLEDFDDFGFPPDVEQRSRVVDMLSYGIWLYCTIGVSLAAVVPLFQIESCKNYNRIHNTSLLCGYCSPMKYPYDLDDYGYMYYSHLIIQLFCGISLISKGSIFLSLLIGCFEAVVIRLEHLVEMLREVFADNDFNAQKVRFRKCAMYHIHILNLAKCINKCYSLITTPALVGYNVIIGVTLLGVLYVKSLYTVPPISVCTP